MKSKRTKTKRARSETERAGSANTETERKESEADVTYCWSVVHDTTKVIVHARRHCRLMGLLEVVHGEGIDHIWIYLHIFISIATSVFVYQAQRVTQLMSRCTHL